MTETPNQQDAPQNPHDDELDVEGPNESNPNTPNANPQDQDGEPAAS
jgi:hypothetical protein